MGFRQPWVALRRQVVSAFQVGVSRAKKCSYSAGDRGLPGVEVGTESSSGAAEGKSSTAGRGTGRWAEAPNSRALSCPGWTQAGQRSPVRTGIGVSGRWGHQGGTDGEESRAERGASTVGNVYESGKEGSTGGPGQEGRREGWAGGNLSPFRSERRKPAPSFLMAQTVRPRPPTQAASNGPSQRAGGCGQRPGAEGRLHVTDARGGASEMTWEPSWVQFQFERIMITVPLTLYLFFFLAQKPNVS